MKRKRGRLDRNVAPFSRPTTRSSALSMNARKCVHAQMPHPSQAIEHESSKFGKRDGVLYYIFIIQQTMMHKYFKFT